MYEYRFGGKEGTTRSLALSEDMLVVRARGSRQPRSSGRVRSRDLMTSLAPVAAFRHANLEVMRVHEAAREANHEAVLAELKDDGGFEFAGHCLMDEISHKPVIYTENLFVSFHRGVRQAVVKSLLDSRSLQVKRRLKYADNAYFVGCPENTGRDVFDLAMSMLMENAEVEFCHPELLRERHEKVVYPHQWHLRRTLYDNNLIDAHVAVEAAWQHSTGSGITVAVIDDGVDIDHVEFRARGEIIEPFDATLNVDDPRPKFSDDNHGTACAGVACASGEDGASGVAPDANLMPIRLMSGLGSQQEADSFVWATQKGADVISCSWGPRDGDWSDPTDPLHQQSVALPDSTRLASQFAATQGRNGRGCVICWAAGNGNESVDNDGYASNPDVIAVGACSDQNRRSVYSDFGRALWCVFPSNDFNNPQTRGIWTTDRLGQRGYNSGNANLDHPHGDYTDDFGGTSSACPGVAGVAALMLAKNPALTSIDVRNIIRDTADKIDQKNAGYDASGHSLLYGYGRVNAANSVNAS